MSKRKLLGFLAVVVLSSIVAVGSEMSSVDARGPAKSTASAPSKKKHKKKPTAKVTSLAVAAAWVDVAAGAKLQPTTPVATPQQFTDPSAPPLGKITPSLLTGLSFKGGAIETFIRTQPDASDPLLLVGNYVVKVIVFGSASDARKFRAADANEVTNRPPSTTPGLGNLKQVGTYMDGVVLDDGMGHVNLMFTIGNVAVDIRLGISETTPGDGAKAIKNVGDAVVANSKKG